MAQAGPETNPEQLITAATVAATATALTLVTAGDLIIDSFAGGYNLASAGKSASPNPGQTQLLVPEPCHPVGLSVAAVTHVPVAGTHNGRMGRRSFRARLTRRSHSPRLRGELHGDHRGGSELGGTGSVSLSPDQLSYVKRKQRHGDSNSCTLLPFSSFSGDLTSMPIPATADGQFRTRILPRTCISDVRADRHDDRAGNRLPVVGQLPCGTTINLNATPGSGYSFGQWNGGGYTGTNGSSSFVAHSQHDRDRGLHSRVSLHADDEP